MLERRVAGPEVVEHEPHAEVLQPLEVGHDRRRHAEEHGLGQLERQRLRLEPAGAQRARDDLEQVGLRELAGGEVDRDPAAGLGDQGRAGAARLLEHPRPDRDDQPRLLGDRDELRGPDLRPDALPPQQRLVRDRRAVGEGHDRLEDELELGALERALEVALGPQPLRRALPQALVEQLDPPAAALLGAVGGGVGVGRSARRGRYRRRCRARSRCSPRAGARCRRR